MHKTRALNLMLSKVEIKHLNQLIQQDYIVCKLSAFHLSSLITAKTGNAVERKNSKLGPQDSGILDLALTLLSYDHGQVP